MGCPTVCVTWEVWRDTLDRGNAQHRTQSSAMISPVITMTLLYLSHFIA